MNAHLERVYDIGIKECSDQTFTKVGTAELCLHPHDATYSAYIVNFLAHLNSNFYMGKKSGKKVKSDRINAVRKQYDAFLEEDRRRKERNEFILGKLDNIRYNSTALQIRNKPIGVPTYGERYAMYTHLSYRPDHRAVITLPPEPHSRQTDVPSVFTDDSSLLKEISKKYILIPRLRPSILNDYVDLPNSYPPVKQNNSQFQPKANIVNNDDWKSKYDILEQLKNNEKGDQGNNYGRTDSVPLKKEQTLTNDILETNTELKTNKSEEFTRKFENEVPEKDVSFAYSELKSGAHSLEPSSINELIKEDVPEINPVETDKETFHENPKANEISDHLSPNQGLEYNLPIKDLSKRITKEQENDHAENANPAASDSNIEDIGQVITNIGNENEQIHSEYFQESEYQQPEEYPNQEPYHEPEAYNEQEAYLQHEEYNQQEGYSAEFNEAINVVSDTVYPDPEKVYLDKDDYSPIEVVNESQINNELAEEQIPVEANSEVEDTQYPVELLRAEDFTPTEGVKLEDGINVNPMFLANEQNEQPTVNISNDNPVAANTEPTPPDNSGIEEFDAEQRDMFYSEETGGFAYDQQPAGDAYNQEYAQNDTYQENPNNMAYYEGAEELQEQAYPVELNEYEETSSRYDQNYEQQYTNQYEEQAYQQEQEIKYDQPPEGYEHTDESQQQYQQYQYEQPDNETTQNIEQVLDTEQGFVERQNTEADMEKPAMEQATEQNLS